MFFVFVGYFWGKLEGEKEGCGNLTDSPRAMAAKGTMRNTEERIFFRMVCAVTERTVCRFNINPRRLKRILRVDRNMIAKFDMDLYINSPRSFEDHKKNGIQNTAQNFGEE